MKNCLLLGRKPIILEDLQQKIKVSGVQFFSGTGLAEVKDIFASQAIDIVIMGAGIVLRDRLDIIQFVFESSKSTTVHMKDWGSGPAGMLPFVEGVLGGLFSDIDP